MRLKDLFVLDHKMEEGVIYPDVDSVIRYLSSENIRNALEKLSLSNNKKGFMDFLNTISISKFKIRFKHDPYEVALSKYEDAGIRSAETETLGRLKGYIFVGINIRQLMKNSLSKEGWNKFLSVLRTVIGHEIIHRKTNEKISDKILKAQLKKYINSANARTRDEFRSYYSDLGELMSYGWQTVEELRDAGYSKEDIKQFLRYPWSTTIPTEHSYTAYTYKKLFKNKQGEYKDVIRKYLSYVYSYLNKFPDKLFKE